MGFVTTFWGLWDATNTTTFLWITAAKMTGFARWLSSFFPAALISVVAARTVALASPVARPDAFTRWTARNARIPSPRIDERLFPS
jgi:hypothetical protein